MSAYPPSAATDPNLPHDSLVSHILGICSAMLVLVTLVVAARFWIRLWLVQSRLGADDWCILVAWALAVAFDLDPINRKYRHVSAVEHFAKLMVPYFIGIIVHANAYHNYQKRNMVLACISTTSILMSTSTSLLRYVRWTQFIYFMIVANRGCSCITLESFCTTFASHLPKWQYYSCTSVWHFRETSKESFGRSWSSLLRRSWLLSSSQSSSALPSTRHGM